MTRKKTLTKDAALLEALRSNLHLLGEIAMRYEVETQPERPEDPPAINCPDDVRRLLGPEMSGLAQEQLRVLLLNTKNLVVGQRVVYQGNVNSSMIRPAEVLRPAVMEAVPSIIISHNHPSQDPTPQPGGRSHHKGAGAGGQAAGHRDARSRRHRRGQVRQPQGAGPHGLMLHKTGRPRPVRLSRRGNRPCASPRHIHRKET